MLTETRRQVLTNFLLLCHPDALIRLLFLVREGVSVHGMHVVNTVCPYLSEVTDKQTPLLLGCLFLTGGLLRRDPLCRALNSPTERSGQMRGLSRMGKGVRFHRNIGDLTTEIVEMIRDEAALLSVQSVAYR